MSKECNAAQYSPLWQKALAGLLCWLMVMPAGAQQANSTAPASAPAGPLLVASVTGYTAGATVNDAPLDPNRALHANDTIKTDASGRIRLRLFGGPALDVGSQTTFKILRNDPAVQQTTLELFAGQLRNEVPEFKAAAANYEIRVPQGVINARSASDVYVQAQPAGSTVRVLKGAATARSNLSQSTIEVAGGNFVELRSAGAGRVQTASTEQIQRALAQTALSGAQVAAPAPVTAAVTPAERQTPPPPARSHLKRNVLILAIIGAAGAGAAAAASGGGGSSSSTTTTPPPTSTGPPTIPPH
jgi:FecR protein